MEVSMDVKSCYKLTIINEIREILSLSSQATPSVIRLLI